MNTYLFGEDDVQVHERLREALNLNNLIIFAGSGLSAQATTDDGEHPPLWKGLLEGMVNWCLKKGLIDTTYPQDFLKLINGDYLTEAGQELEEILTDKSQFQQCLNDVLLCNQAKISDAHKLIVQIPFRAYLTTNYDRFIESAFLIEKGTELKSFYGRTRDGVAEAYRNHEPFIFKLHGDINDLDSIVLGSQSYEKHLHSSENEQLDLQTLFMVSSVLFIGFGGSDPNIEKIIRTVAMSDGNRKRHWMLVPAHTFPSLKMKRLWKDKGINVIQYKKDSTHSGLTNFLRKIKTPPSLSPTPLEHRGEIKSFERKRIIENIEENYSILTHEISRHP